MIRPPVFAAICEFQLCSKMNNLPQVYNFEHPERVMLFKIVHFMPSDRNSVPLNFPALSVGIR